MSRRNKAAILSGHIDTVSNRLIAITAPIASGGAIDSASVAEYKKWYQVREGLKIILAEYGDKKRTPLFLTAGGTFRQTKAIIVVFGNQVQNQRANEGVSPERLAEHDAAYKFLSNKLKDMSASNAAQAAASQKQWKASTGLVK
jgi:hypothetical protein